MLNFVAKERGVFMFDEIITLRKNTLSSLNSRRADPRELASMLEVARQNRENPDSKIRNQAIGFLATLGKWNLEIAELEAKIGEVLLKRFPELGLQNLNSAELTSVAALYEVSRVSFDQAEMASLARTVVRSIRQNDQIELMCFSCPETDFSYLCGDFPDDFIRTLARKNTLSQFRQTNRKIFNFLNQVSRWPIRLTIIVGELDEESYIFPVLGYFGTNPQALSVRREKYRESLRQQTAAEYPGLDFQIIGWSKMAPTQLQLVANDNLPSLGYLENEMEVMKTIMQPGKYYDGVLTPDTTQLRLICALKMATYATQGLVIKELFPNSIGIQNEQPPLLRTLMLNSAFISLGLETIPFIYPYNLIYD